MSRPGSAHSGHTNRPAAKPATTLDPRPPSIRFGDHVVADDETVAIAAAWAEDARARLTPRDGMVALALANRPSGVALWFALSTLPVPLIQLAPDPRTWRSSPALPAGTPLFLPRDLEHVREAAEEVGLRPHVLDRPRMSSPRGTPRFLATPGFVTFTSGSTGRPKPVYITTRSFELQTAAAAQAYGLDASTGVVVSLPIAGHYGLGHGLMVPTLTGAPIALVERFAHRAVLDVFRLEAYPYWAATPLMADVLARAPLHEPAPPGPRICHLSAGALVEPVSRAFLHRFRTPLRPSYGKTESGFITAETSPPSEIRPETVGRAAPGIELCIGDDPRTPYPPGEAGRVWLRSPWYMEGYGYPPDLAVRDGRDGWWPTEDIGTLDRSGYLTLAGRLDDCFKTTAGHLVSPALVTGALVAHAGVRQAVVVPIPGPAIGALVEADGVDPDALRTLAARELPPWLQPSVLLVTPEIPLLPSGKVDRERVITLLAEAGARPETPWTTSSRG